MTEQEQVVTFEWEGKAGHYVAHVHPVYGEVFVRSPGSAYFTQAGGALRDLILDLCSKGMIIKGKLQ